MPTVANRIRRWLRPDRPASAPAPATFAAPPKVIEAPAIEGPADGQSRVVPMADPLRSYVSGFGGRLYSGFSYGPGSATTLDAHAGEITREFGPRILEAMRRDPKVNSSLNTRKAGILAGGLQISPAIQADPTAGPDSDEANDPDVLKAAEIAEFCQRLVDRLDVPVERILSELLDAMVHGVKLAEITFEFGGDGPDKGKLVWKSVRVKPNAAWGFLVDPALSVLGYIAKSPIERKPDPAANGQASDSRMGGYVVLPPDKCLTFAFRPRDGDPRGTTILDAAYVAWNFKAQTWGEYGKYLVQFASATRVGVAAPGAVSEAPRDATGNPTGGPKVTPEEALAAKLEASRNGSCIALPAGADVKDLHPAGAGEPFLNVFEYCDREIVFAICEAIRATLESEHGSKADSQTGQDILGQSIRLDKIDLAHAVRKAFRVAVRLNFGDDAADRLTPNVSLGGTESQDKAAMLGAYASVGYSIDPSQLPWIDHDLGIKVREPEPEPQPIAGPDEVVGEGKDEDKLVAAGGVVGRAA